MVKIYRSRLNLKVTPEEEFFGSDPPRSCPDFLDYLEKEYRIKISGMSPNRIFMLEYKN